ncbi:hypothetical protein [Consotaella salsifontis]|uniref:hypothetical protein n=1 Tax=Consotaella salsifontis TaxID=1365950 RepID=UPI001054F830|nr:hypothetical protein [Consotaella salsifontis]
MPDARKAQVDRSRELPRELDMPVYRYQHADSRSFTLTYSERQNEEKAGTDKSTEQMEPILSALSFSC